MNTTETPIAYQTALDQLRRERDDLSARFNDLLATAKLAAQGNADGARELTEARQIIGRLQDERTELRAQLEAVTAERGTDNIRHDFAAASQENIRLRLAVENLKTMFHAAIDAAGRVS